MADETDERTLLREIRNGEEIIQHIPDADGTEAAPGTVNALGKQVAALTEALNRLTKGQAAVDKRQPDQAERS